MFKRGLIFAALLATTLAFWAPAQDKIQVTFWHAMSGGLGETVDTLVAQFNEQSETTEVTAVFQGNYGDLFQKNLASVAAGEPPTITQMFENWTPSYLQPALDENALAPIQGLIDPAIVADIPGIFVSANTYTIDGEATLTTIPFNKSATVLYYNQETVPNPPTTWQELLDLSQSLNADTDGDGEDDVFGFYMRPGSSGVGELYLTYLKMAGGSIIADDCRSVNLNGAEALTAAQFMKDLADVSLTGSDFEDGLFANGTIQMYYSTSAGIVFATRSVGDNFPWTTFGGLQGPAGGSSVIQGTNLGIFQMNHSQEQVEAAADFVAFLVDVPQTVFWAQETGYLPVRTSAIESTEFQDFLASSDTYRAPTESLDNAFITPGLEEWSDARLTIADAIEAILVGGVDLQATLDQLDADVDEALSSVPTGIACTG